MFVETKKVLTLQKQLAASTTLAPHINEVDAECTKFWDEVSALLGDELARASQSNKIKFLFVTPFFAGGSKIKIPQMKLNFSDSSIFCR